MCNHGILPNSGEGGKGVTSGNADTCLVMRPGACMVLTSLFYRNLTWVLGAWLLAFAYGRERGCGKRGHDRRVDARSGGVRGRLPDGALWVWGLHIRGWPLERLAAAMLVPSPWKSAVRAGKADQGWRHSAVDGSRRRRRTHGQGWTRGSRRAHQRRRRGQRTPPRVDRRGLRGQTCCRYSQDPEAAHPRPHRCGAGRLS